MSYRRNGLRALTLSFAAALAMMAFSAAGAQAQSFVVELSLALAVGAEFTAEDEGLGLLQVLDLNIYLDCNNASAKGTIETATRAKGTASFSECQVLDNNKKVNELCEVDTINAGGLALAIGLDEILLEPHSGEAFTTVLFLDSHIAILEELECNLDEKNKVDGAVKVLVLYVSPLHETTPVLHLEAKVLLLEPPAVQGDVLKFGGHTSHLVEGKLVAALTGTETGKCWGIE
jgi:hypothetical protein